MQRQYDVIVCGGSFAGLAVAYEVGDGCFILDKKNIGKRQTSACALPLKFIDYYGLSDTILQKHNHIYLHTPIGIIKFVLSYTYVTINYEKFCKSILQKSGAGFELASVRSISKSSISTDNGDYSGNFIVNCLGWNFQDYRNKDLAFGLEGIFRGRGEGLHFWIDNKVIRNGYGWCFPAGDFVRIGVISYEGKTDLKDTLRLFAGKLGYAKPVEFHGDWLPYKIGECYREGVFYAGNSAGHCFGLTGEGIKGALYFGRECGRTIKSIIEGRISAGKGVAAYKGKHEDYMKRFDKMTRLQKLTVGLPDIMLYPAMFLARFKPLSNHLLNRYLSKYLF